MNCQEKGVIEELERVKLRKCRRTRGGAADNVKARLTVDFPVLTPSALFRLQYSLCNERLIELSNSGASGSLFYVSSDDEYIIKTVQHKEAEFLQKLLPGYFMVRPNEELQVQDGICM